MPLRSVAEARAACYQELTRLAIPRLDIDQFLDQTTVGERWITLVCLPDDDIEDNLCLNWQSLFDHISMLETPDLLWMADKWQLEPSIGRENLAQAIVQSVEQRIENALKSPLATPPRYSVGSY